MASYRYEGDEVDLSLAKKEAKLLHDKVIEKCYNDDDFIRIITTRSKAQITATLNSYKDEFGQEINKVRSCLISKHDDKKRMGHLDRIVCKNIL